MTNYKTVTVQRWKAGQESSLVVTRQAPTKQAALEVAATAIVLHLAVAARTAERDLADLVAVTLAHDGSNGFHMRDPLADNFWYTVEVA